MLRSRSALVPWYSETRAADFCARLGSEKHSNRTVFLRSNGTGTGMLAGSFLSRFIAEKEVIACSLRIAATRGFRGRTGCRGA